MERYEEFWNHHFDIAQSKGFQIQLSEEFKQLIWSMLAYEYRMRPSLAEVQQSPWMTMGPVPTQEMVMEEFRVRKEEIDKRNAEDDN